MCLGGAVHVVGVYVPPVESGTIWIPARRVLAITSNTQGAPAEIAQQAPEHGVGVGRRRPKIDTDGGILHTQPVEVRGDQRARSIDVDSYPSERSLTR
jgi:hypothetical protein